MEKLVNREPAERVAQKLKNIGSKGIEEKKIPASLTLQKCEDMGEKSPKPTSVLELFKRYKKSEKKPKIDSEDEETYDEKCVDEVNVGFDKMSTDEKTGFLEKLKMLTIEKKSHSKSDIVSESASRAAKFLKRITPIRRHETSSEAEMKYERNFHDKPRKDASRKLNFGMDSKKSGRKEMYENEAKHVAIMTREYEKICAGQRGVPIRKPYRKQTPRGSLETPTDSPMKGSLSPLKPPYEFDDTDLLPKKGRALFKRQCHGENVSNSASWHGELPPRDYTSPTFSRKIFVGGVPWDITESALKESFGEFGNCSVEWPGQEARYRNGQISSSPLNSKYTSKLGGTAATGYVYMIFEDEGAVASLLLECSQEVGGAGEWFFMIRAQRSKSSEIRQVQIIPWVTSDSLYCENESIMEVGIEPKRTVFVGALHGMMTAQVLHSIMEDCFGMVECVQLDTDKFKYPIGSGRVTFSEHGAYFKSIEMGYLFVHTSKFKKRVQIDPFLESTNCMVCNKEMAHCFCRNRDCFKYYCNNCWKLDHNNDSKSEVHIPVIVPSSASKAHNGLSRRLNSYSTNSPVKSSVSQSIGTQYLVGGAPLPVLVGAPTPTLSTIYGYMTQPTPISPSQHAFLSPSYDSPISQSESCLPRFNNVSHGNTVITTSPTLYMSTMMTPQKGSSNEVIMPSVYGTSSQFFPSQFCANTMETNSNRNPPVQSTPIYGPNIFYGYLPQNANNNMPSIFNTPPQKSFH